MLLQGLLVNDIIPKIFAIINNYLRFFAPYLQFCDNSTDFILKILMFSDVIW